MIVSVDEVKNALHVDGDDEDEFISTLIQNAVSKAESFCRVRFEAMDTVPGSVIQAILLQVAHWYQYRDESETGAYNATEDAFQALLWPHRDVNLLL